MKKSALLILAAGLIFLSSCTNQNSSTVATQDEEQDTATEVPGKNEKDHTEVKKEGTIKAYADSTGTATSASHDSIK